jgi:hypothetical protein
MFLSLPSCFSGQFGNIGGSSSRGDSDIKHGNGMSILSKTATLLERQILCSVVAWE